MQRPCQAVSALDKAPVNEISDRKAAEAGTSDPPDEETGRRACRLGPRRATRIVGLHGIMNICREAKLREGVGLGTSPLSRSFGRSARTD